MRWNAANLIVSILGAALNLFLLTEGPVGHKPLYSLISVLLILRAVRFGFKIGDGKPRDARGR